MARWQSGMMPPLKRPCENDVSTWHKQCPHCLYRYEQLHSHLEQIHRYSISKADDAVQKSIDAQLAVIPTTSRSNLYSYVPSSVGKTIIMQIECYLQSLGHCINEDVPLPDHVDAIGVASPSPSAQENSPLNGHDSDDGSNVTDGDGDDDVNDQDGEDDSDDKMSRSDVDNATEDSDIENGSEPDSDDLEDESHKTDMTPASQRMVSTRKLRQGVGLSNKVTWFQSGDQGCPHLQSFFHHLDNSSKGSRAISIMYVHMISKLFHYVQSQLGLGTDVVDVNCLMNSDLVLGFYNILESGLTPQGVGLQPKTLAKEIDAMKRYLTFLGLTIDEHRDQDLHKQVVHLKGLMDVRGISKSISRGAPRSATVAEVRSFQDKPITTDEIEAAFLQYSITDKLDDIKEQHGNLKKPRPVNKCEQSYKFFTRYLFTKLSLTNYRLPKVVGALTVDDFSGSKLVDGKYHIMVESYKSTLDKLAHFIIDEDMHHMMKVYLHRFRQRDVSDRPCMRFFRKWDDKTPIANPASIINLFRSEFRNIPKIVNTSRLKSDSDSEGF